MSRSHLPRITLFALALVQTLCAVVFVGDILINLLGLRREPLDWQVYELIEVGAAFGLILGLAFGWIGWLSSLRRQQAAEQRLRAASGAFLDLIAERFTAWGLTQAERDVALFAIKGLSTADIAALRGTSEGTIKAQTAAIYRKAGVSGRPQLLSLFIDDLMDDSLTAAPAAPQDKAC